MKKTFILTNEQMRNADEYTIRELGVSSLTLMERAGKALADEAEKLCPSGAILCLCGGGNNGGDGFVCARILKKRGRTVSVLFHAEKMSSDCRTNMEKWTAMGGFLTKELPQNCALVVDCLYGTGFHGALCGKDEEVVKQINALKTQGVKVLSADIPSGINGDDGLVRGVAVSADKTLCIGEIKVGVLLGDGIDYAGAVERVDIGISLPSIEEYAVFSEKEWVKELFPKRKRNSHKGSYGRAAIVAGSMEYTGAAYLSASACLCSGAGYTTLFVPKNILPFYVLKSPEILLKNTNEGYSFSFCQEKMQEIAEHDSVAYGMGMGCSEETAKGAVWLLRHYEGKLILDADGLNSLAQYEKENLPTLLQNKKCDLIITPHCKEFSRLTGKSVVEILGEGIFAVRKFARQHKTSVLLKNAVSVVANEVNCALNTAGTSGQAKGGSGDVLAGVIAGLCAMGISAYEAGVLGAYLCGKAAEFATRQIGEYSLTASDIIAYLGEAFCSIHPKNTYKNGAKE